jgi:hypothetical protein
VLQVVVGDVLVHRRARLAATPHEAAQLVPRES